MTAHWGTTAVQSSWSNRSLDFGWPSSYSSIYLLLSMWLSTSWIQTYKKLSIYNTNHGALGFFSPLENLFLPYNLPRLFQGTRFYPSPSFGWSSLKGKIYLHWHKIVDGAKNMPKSFFQVGRTNMWIYIMALNTIRSETRIKY